MYMGTNNAALMYIINMCIVQMCCTKIQKYKSMKVCKYESTKVQCRSAVNKIRFGPYAAFKS